ncbi:MAG: DUF58 domain-containing protein [Deltaproteobacteria bacterium]|nr:DUF58 domain-containing protein [Candidatus Zymogenaceae bacterium]
MSDRLSRISARVIKWLKPPRTLAINSLGWYFIAFIFAVGLAAVNTGNNLLYLILGGMLSFIVASGILSNINLKNLIIRRHLPEYLFARTPTLVRVEIENGKRYVPSFILLVRTSFPVGSSVLIATVGPERNAEGFMEVIFPKRGFHEIEPFKVSTRFPFGLFTKGMEAAAVEKVLVFPHLSSAEAPDFDSRGREGETALIQSGQGADPFSIKDFQPGDNPRHIHWKSTAKRGKFMRREFSKEQEPAVTIRVGSNSDDTENVLEEKIERAASMAAHFTMEGYAVAVECGSATVPFGRGRDHLLVVLRELALCDLPGTDRGKRTAGSEQSTVIEL